jgi:alpha-mannosidase
VPAERERSSSAIRVHLVGNAHIDPAWLWSYAEGRAEVLATYRAAVEFLHEVPDLMFTAGGSVTYTWVEQDDPPLLDQIRQLVVEGRWCLVNGWWVEPDCNLPSSEAFARHALYGQRTLERLFGRRTTVGYNVDSFGHNAALPGTLPGGGLSSYIFSRPDPRERDLPADYFWWEGVDGSRVLAARLTAHYEGSPEELPDRVARSAAAAHPALRQVLCFFGIGDHGGGPR